MTRWLTKDEQLAWRRWLAMQRLMHEVLDRELREETGVSMADYEILVHLSESPDRRVRMADLAHATLASRSRLSHQIDRMERAGWVTRERCREDLRGQWAIMTEDGWSLIQRAAPVHVEGVRRHMVDPLGDRFIGFGELCNEVVAPLMAALPGVSPPLLREDAAPAAS